MAKVDIFAKQENTMVDSLKGQKILIWGDSDTGKTYQTTRMEKPILLCAEPGGNARNVPQFAIPDWDTFVDIVSQLTKHYDKASELYSTCIIDTCEALVEKVEEKVAKRFGVAEVGMVQQADPKNNPNGYSLARTMFRQQINLLCSYGYTVVFISHGQEVDYTDPLTEETYKKLVPYGSEKEKGSTRFVRNICDFVIYVQAQGIDKETNETIYSKALCKETKRAFARSRYPIQTYIEKFTAENLVEAIQKAIRKAAEQEGAGLTEFKHNNSAYTKEDYFDMIKPYFMKLSKACPEYVTSLLKEQLGEGRKLTSATNDELVELSNIYNDCVTFCNDRGYVVE